MKDQRPSIFDVPQPLPQPMEAPTKDRPYVPVTEENIDDVQEDLDEIARKSILPEKIDPNDPSQWN